MTYTYAQLEAIRGRINADLDRHENALDAAVAQFSAVDAAMSQMMTTYGGPGNWAQQVDQFAAANPNSEAAQLLKAQKDALAAEFGSKQTRARALKAAVEGR